MYVKHINKLTLKTKIYLSFKAFLLFRKVKTNVFKSQNLIMRLLMYLTKATFFKNAIELCRKLTF